MAGLADGLFRGGVLNPALRNGRPRTREEFEAEAAANAADAYGDFGGGLAGAVRGMVGSTKAYAASGLDAMGAKGAAQSLYDSAAEDAARASAISPQIATTDQITDGSTLGRYVAGKLGGAAGSLPPALLGGVAGRMITKSGLGAAVGAGAAYQPVMAGGHVQELNANENTAGMDPTEKFLRGTGVGTIQAGVEGLGPAYIANRLFKRNDPATSFGGAARNFGTDVLKGSALEGGGAAVSDVIGQGGMMQADPTVSFDGRQTFEAGIGEAVGGAGFAVPGAAVANTLDYLNAGKNLAVDGAEKRMPGALDATQDFAGKAVDKAKDVAQTFTDAGAMFKNTAVGYMKHPELAKLVAAQELPPELDGATEGEILDWLAQDSGARHRAAIQIAQRTLIDREASDNEKVIAQQLLDNPTDPESWKPFADGMILKHKQERLANKAAAAVSKMSGWVEGKVGKSKSNLEPTAQDAAYLGAMRPTLVRATGVKDDRALDDISLAVREFLLSDAARDEAGWERLPTELTEAFGDSTPEVLAKAYDALRRQGLTRDIKTKQELTFYTPEVVKRVVGQQLKVRNAAADVMHNNLALEALPQMPARNSQEFLDIADGIRDYLQRGKKDDTVEQYLDTMFGPNKDDVLEAVTGMNTTVQSSLGRGMADAAASMGKLDDVDGAQVAAEGETGADADMTLEDSYNAGFTELQPDDTDTRYLFKGQKNEAFDTEDAFLDTNLDLARKGLAPQGRALKYNRDTKEDQLKLDRVGVMDYASETGDRKLLDSLLTKYPDLTHEQINQRFFVAKNEASEMDQGEAVDVRPEDLNIAAGKKGSWQARTRIDRPTEKGGNIDVSTIANGRLYLSGDGHKTPFVTSSRVLISHMWNRKKLGAFDEGTAAKVGTDDKLAMFSAGLTSLLDAGGFTKIEVKTPDGEMFQVDALEALPDDFVIWDSNDADAKLTLGQVKGLTNKKFRAKKQKELEGQEPLPKKETEQVSAYDIPNMTRAELGEAAGKAAVALKKAEGQVAALEGGIGHKNYAKLDGIRQAQQKKFDSFIAAYHARVTDRAPGQKKEQALEPAAKIAGTQTTVIDRDGKGNIFSKATAADYAGKNDRVVKQGDRWVVERDIGHKVERKLEHLTETEEMSAATKESERKFDEETGLELQPRDGSTRGHANLLQQRVTKLRAEYKELAEQVAKYEAKEGKNALREAALKRGHAKLAALVEQGKKLAAELAKLPPVDPKPTSTRAKEAAAEQKRKDAPKPAKAETAVEVAPAKAEAAPTYTSDQIDAAMIDEKGYPSTNAESMAFIEAMKRRFDELRALKKKVGEESFYEDHGPESVAMDYLDGYFRPGHVQLDAKSFLYENDEFFTQAKAAQDKASAAFDAKWKELTIRSSLENPTGKTMTADQKAEVSSYIEKTLGPKVAVLITDQMKGSGEWSRDANNQNAAIKIATTALNPLSVAHHEAMHEFFQRLLDGKYERAANVLRTAADSPLIKRQLQRHFAGQDAVLKQIENDVEERIAYMFQLWASGKLDIGTQTETVFRKIVNIIRKTLGLVSQEKQLEAILQSFHDGKMAEPGAMAQVLDSQEARAKYLKKIGAKANPALKKANEWVGFAENALTGNKNPFLDALGRTLNNKTGSKKDAQGFLSAKEQANNLYMNKFATALRGIDPTGKDKDVATKADVDLALEGLQAKTWHKDPLVLRIQQQVAGVFEEMMQYMKDAGIKVFNPETKQWEEVREIKDYRIPRSWDPAKIIEHSGRFKETLLEHHTPQLTRIAKKANEEVAAGKGAGDYTASHEKLDNGGKTEITAEDVATAITNRLINANGQWELKESAAALGFSPFAKSVNEQTLDWIDEAAFVEFMEKDIVKIVSTYVGQVTKRGEYSRRFGPDGGVMQKAMDSALDWEIDDIMESRYEVKGALKKAKEAAAGYNTLARKNKLPETTWQEELGKMTLGAAEGKDIVNDAVQSLEPARRAIMAMEGTLGHDISVLARKASAYTIVYQNVRLLGYALFANLIDPLGMMVNGAEFKDAYSAFKRGMRDVGREWGDLTGIRKAKDGDRDDAVRVAEMIGTVDSSGFMSQMGTIYSSQYLPEWAKNANDTFFRWNGLEAFNKSMRVGATQAAISFIKRHYESPNDHSDRYFEELGLTRADVQLGPDGSLNVENRQVQQAVMRWVDGAILRPNAAIRPTMSSDPHYAVFYHLKQFMYAMHAIILKRVVTEIKNGNNDPLILLFAGYVPMMLAADTAKGLIQEATGNGQPYWQHDSIGGVVAHGVERAGLLGVGQLLTDTVNYGPLGLFGPAVEQAAGIVTQPLGDSVADATMIGPLSMELRGPDSSSGEAA